MTFVTANLLTDRPTAAPERTALRRLRMILTTNAVTSFAGGAIGLAAASTLSDELGFDHLALTRIISIGLMVFAFDVAMLARSGAERTVKWAAAVSIADFTWVAATITLIALGTLTTAGVAMAIALGFGVLDFGVLQLWFRGRAGA